MCSSNNKQEEAKLQADQTLLSLIGLILPVLELNSLGFCISYCTSCILRNYCKIIIIMLYFLAKFQGYGLCSQGGEFKGWLYTLFSIEV